MLIEFPPYSLKEGNWEALSSMSFHESPIQLPKASQKVTPEARRERLISILNLVYEAMIRETESPNSPIQRASPSGVDHART